MKNHHIILKNLHKNMIKEKLLLKIENQQTLLHISSLSNAVRRALLSNLLQTL